MKIGDTFFGSWRIDKRLGRGSYGTVYRLTKSDFGETYYSAMKVIFVSEDDMSDEFLSEIKNEISLMARFKGHSNIVSFEDYEIVKEDDGSAEILIRMEYLEPLLQYEKTHTLTFDDVIKLGVDMCTAIEICENNSIIHRDIKPENIFVSPNGDFKLGDFGIARTIEKNCSSLSRKGTFAYMAPEIYKGDVYDSTVDLYSLGIVLYRALNSGKLPFVEQDNAPANVRETASKRRLNGEKLPVLNDSALMQTVITSCEYISSARYQTATELKEALLAAKASDNAVAEKAKKFDFFNSDILILVLKILVGVGLGAVVILILMLFI